MYLIQSISQMNPTMPPQPPLTCRMCIPPVHFFVYEQFRKHLRCIHSKKKLLENEVRQFENYPRAMANIHRGPPSTRWQRRGENPANAGGENQAPVLDAATVENNQSNTEQIRAMVEEAVERKMAELRASNSVPEPVSNDTVLQNLVNNSVRDRISEELKHRLPLLGNEIRARAREEVHVVVQKLMGAAAAYAEDCERAQSVTPPAPSAKRPHSMALNETPHEYVRNRLFVSDGLNVHVSFKSNPSAPNIDQAGPSGGQKDTPAPIESCTLSDEELLNVSPSVLDGSKSQVSIQESDLNT